MGRHPSFEGKCHEVNFTYAFPPGGLPEQSVDPAASGALFNEAYVFQPACVMRDIVTSLLPGWTKTRAWILARPLTGLAETFAQYSVEVEPGGGSENPEPDPKAEDALFVAAGKMTLVVEGQAHTREAGEFAFLPPGCNWTLRNGEESLLKFHWIRKRWVPAPGLEPSGPVFSADTEDKIDWMPGTRAWGTTRFLDPSDVSHDMHVNIVTFEPGGRIPFAETHVMEHGLYVLQGTAKYLLNKDWVDVGPGDFMWLRAWCPQACIATGEEPFRYLLYKDVNRHPALTLSAL